MEWPAKAYAYCPTCREDLSASPEEVAAKPTLSEMVETAGEPLAAVGGLALGYFEAAFALASLVSLFAAVATRDWRAAGAAVFFLALTALSVWAKVREMRGQTGATDAETASETSEQLQ
jgi:hypothetical protein